MMKKIICLFAIFFSSVSFANKLSPEEVAQLQAMQKELMPVVQKCEADGRVDTDLTYDCYFDGTLPLIENGNFMALLVMIKLSKDFNRDDEFKQWQAYLNEMGLPQDVIAEINKAINMLP